MKKTLVYLNPDCYTDTDLTVLKHLTNDFRVVWYYIHESKKVNKITIENAEKYAYKNGIELHIVDPKVRKRSIKNLWFYWNIANDINRIHPYIIFHCERNPYWAIAIKLRLKCRKVIFGVHDAKSHSSSFSISMFLEKITKDLVLKVHEFFVTFSEGQKDLLKKEYGRDSYMVGMSYKFFGDSRLKRDNIGNGVKLLFFGSINKYKGLDLLISALEQLRSEGTCNISLTIAGKGDFEKTCEQLIKTPEMYNLQIRFVDNAEIPDLMSSHHFLVLPYRDATQSGPLATAVAYELPVIAPNFGCFKETYSSKSALLYEQGHIKEALTEVSNMTGDKYEAMRNACKMLKDAYSEETIALNYVKCFNDILE